MFEDIDNARRELTISRESTDRVIVYAIWTRDEAGALPVDEAWSVLQERYPNDARLTLCGAFEELVSSRAPGGWSPSYFLEKVWRVLDAAGGRLNPEVRDLLAVAHDHLHPLGEDEAARLERIRRRVGARTGDATAAQKRLTRFATDLVRELHDRTVGGKPIASGGSESSANAWKKAMESATGDKRRYAPTERLAVGDVVEHPKFGAGVVTSVEAGRASVLFESGSRKLVAGSS